MKDIIMPGPDSRPAAPIVSVGTVYNDCEVLESHLLSSLREIVSPVDTLLLNNTGNLVTNNIASIYNMLLKLEGPEYLALLHPDISFKEHFFADVMTAIETLSRSGKKWGALGIVGRSWEGDYLWCHHVSEPTPVCTLDSCSLIISRSNGLSFDDKRFNEFHCYVEDYCLQCHDKGLGVFVVPTVARHGSATKNVRGSAWGKYRRYYWTLRLKWWRKFRQIYTC